MSTTVQPGAVHSPAMTDPRLAARIEAIYTTESRRVFATLIRLLGDFDLAEDALHDAFMAAMQQWPRDGIPTNPRSWLVSAGRFKAIDRLRRRARFDSSLATIAHQIDLNTSDEFEEDDEGFGDDRLRLIFTCCHPLLSPEARLALTLREVCGLTTEEIARAFLTNPPTLAQRIVRAKSRIRDAKIPYQTPEPAELPERLEAVLHVIYLMFNEGYAASSGEELTRSDLSGEAIRLGRLLCELLPDPEVRGLLALMLLQESRRAARATADGDIILLDDQDRRLWNREMIAEGTALMTEAINSGPVGAYTLQAAIAAVHANTTKPGDTDWNEIVALYGLLARVSPSPVIELNRAVAIAKRDGPAAGLALIDALFAKSKLAQYHLAHAARADMLRQLENTDAARDAYRRALDLATQEPERRFLLRRLAELPAVSEVVEPELLAAG